MPVEDYTLEGRGARLRVVRDGQIEGWLVQVRSGGRRLWALSPASPVRRGEPPAPCESASEALAHWVSWVESDG